jgi:hypothetical protein
VCGVLTSYQLQAEQKIAKFFVVPTHELDGHSQCFCPFLRVKLSSLGVAGQSDPCGVGVSQFEKKIYNFNIKSKESKKK